MDFIALRPGTLLHHGAYEIRSILGKGGFGITYLAYDANLDKEVAIKEFFPSSLCSREATTNHITLGTRSAAQTVEALKTKFIKEAKNIARLNHPNIIRIFAAFEENNTAYYVMEYIKGNSLAQIIKNHGPMPQNAALNYISQIGNALEYLHSNHMTHLDVKPANIMVRSSDRCPILIDFGLSKNYDNSGDPTNTKESLGVSPGYSPVEQYNMIGRQAFSPKSDLYSLSATLYFLLTAQTPPEATVNDSSRLYFPPGIAPNVQAAIVKAMSMQARYRHETVKEFLNHLEDSYHGNSDNSNGYGNNMEETKPFGGNQSQPYEPYKPYPPRQNNGNNKSLMLMAVIGVLGVICIICLWAIFGGRKNEPKYTGEGTINYETGSKTARNVSTTMSRGPMGKRPNDVKPDSKFGPFASKQEVQDFISTYNRLSMTGDVDPDMVADRISTDFGTPKSFSRSEYIANARKHVEKNKIEKADKDVQWDAMKITSDGDGGIKVSYPSIYTRTIEKNGRDVTQQYSLYTDFYINSKKQLYKYKETTKKI